MDVYLDAVFHPRAVTDEGWWVLRQEGWRYDVSDADDDSDRILQDETTTTTVATKAGTTTLKTTTGTTTKATTTTTTTSPQAKERPTNTRAKFEYKGVVFSEMKGAYSDPEDYLDRITQELLFPDSPYHYDSGGDPSIIPTLTREEFVGFYEKYYHPTNARLFIAGDEIDVYHALSKADGYMTPFGYNPASRKDSLIPYQQRSFKKPLSERRPFAVAAGEDEEGSEGFMLCITWLLNTQPLSPMMELAWIVLDSLLLGKASSPLTKTLEDSGLGEELIGGGMDNELLQSTFAIGMKGIKTREDVNALEDLIMDTLHSLDTDGFNEDMIASSMNTIEFQLREGGGGLRGMEIFLGALTKWNYDLNPADALVYESALKDLKDEISRTGSNLFQQMIRDFLITNNHRVVLELFPSTTLEADQLKVRHVLILTLRAWPMYLKRSHFCLERGHTDLTRYNKNV
jgi:Zn-dependent M16 (insulinase) family peptidase